MSVASSPASTLTIRPSRAQWLIIAAHLVLALLYGAINPPWEAHDETGHFAYVNHLATQRTLPDAYSNDKVLFDQAHQPPAYYAVAAMLTGWMDRSDGVGPQFNRFALDGTNRRGARIMLRQPGEAFPWSGTIAALHGVRVVSALLTMLSILLIALSANTVFGTGTVAALLTTAFAAFNPQVIFMGSMVNNDAMVSLAGALVAFCVLRIAARSFQTHPLSFIALGVALGLAFLSKNSALALIGFVVVALAIVAWQQRWPVRQLVIRGALTAAAFALVAGPYVAYTVSRYGRLLLDRNVNNPILQAPTAVIGEGLFVSIRDAWLPQLFANTFNTFWGKFGWGNVGLPEWAYLALAALCAVGVVGCVVGWRRASRDLRTTLLLLLLLGLSMMALPLYRAIYFQDPALLPGRYLMPALTAYAALLGYGCGNLRLGDRDSRFAPAHPPLSTLHSLLPAVLFAFALAVPFAFIVPAYAPNVVAASSAPALLRFGDVAEVTSVNAQAIYLPDREGSRHYARVRLTWRALSSTGQHYVFGVSVLGRDNEVLGTMTVYPNKGNFPSTNWHTGDTFVDEYDILLEKPCARLPALGRISVSVFQFSAPEATGAISITKTLPATDGQGREISPIIGRFKVDEAPPFAVFWQPPLANFDGIWLREVSLPNFAKPGDTVRVNLTYEMLQPNGREGTAFVHLLDASGKPITQDDHAPQRGNLPTDMWTSGECVREPFELTIPANAHGPLHAVTGFYDANFARFPTGTKDDLVTIGEIEVR